MKITINAKNGESTTIEHPAHVTRGTLRSMIGERHPNGGTIESIEYYKTWRIMGAKFKGKEVIK